MQEGKIQINRTASAPAHATLDVAGLARSMRGKLDGSDDGRRLQQRGRPTIYRVIPGIRQTDNSAYDPKVVSIGPFHRDNEGLRAMQEVKWRYLHDLLARGGPDQAKLDRSIAEVGELVEDIRGTYAEEFKDIADDKFVEMMVLDGCFILELMIKLEREGRQSVSASLPGGKWALPHLLNDLMLVENQIPFFVLETLFKAMAPIPSPSTVEELAFSSHVARPLPPEKMPPPQFLHLLHMIHYCHHDVEKPPAGACPCSWWAAYWWLLVMGRIVGHAVFQVCFRLLCFRLFYSVVSCLVCSYTRRSYYSFEEIINISVLENINASRFGVVIPNVTKLKEAGVRFKRKEFKYSEGAEPQKAWFAKKVTFSDDGVFEIPFMVLDRSSNSQLRNLVAFEQCCRDLPGVELYLTAYCILMALLLDTESDVDVLVERGIIFNVELRPGEVAALFDNACSGVAHDPGNIDEAYGDLIQRVMMYLRNDIHRWRAKLVHDYFGNPWAIASVVAAVVLLVLTVLQTVYTVCAYYHRR